MLIALDKFNNNIYAVSLASNHHGRCSMYSLTGNNDIYVYGYTQFHIIICHSIMTKTPSTLSAVPLSLPAICHILILLYFVFATELKYRFGNNNVNFKRKLFSITTI